MDECFKPRAQHVFCQLGLRICSIWWTLLLVYQIVNNTRLHRKSNLANHYIKNFILSIEKQKGNFNITKINHDSKMFHGVSEIKHIRQCYINETMVQVLSTRSGVSCAWRTRATLNCWKKIIIKIIIIIINKISNNRKQTLFRRNRELPTF